MSNLTTTTTTGRTAGSGLAGPLIAGLSGAVVFGLAMTAGAVFELNATEGDTAFESSELWFYVISPLLAVTVAAWFGQRALADRPDRLARTAIALAICAVATVVVFWTGWPLVLGAVAAYLGVEHRRRLGSFTPATGLAVTLGILTLLASTYICVTG